MADQRHAAIESAEPLFVDRAAELAEFDALLADLQRGRRRHLALLGLRRVGKTMLLDEVRRRHPRAAIAYLALDEVVSSPEDFARALASEVLRAAAAASGGAPPDGQSDPALHRAAQTLDARIQAALDDLLEALRTDRAAATASYGRLLVAAMRFPAVVSNSLGLPLVVMLDEFQEITRLQAFPGTDNLLGTLRAALDRPGRAAYVVAGSRVSALHGLLADGENPLFTRFEQLELRPFVPEATHDLATRTWDEEGLAIEPDAAVRLHRLTGGWPFYVHAVAARARQLARAADGRITDDAIDLAFRQELIGRAAAVGQYCRYLLDTALRTDATGLRNTIEAVLRQVARWQPLTRASLERRLRRHYAHTSIHTAVNRLIDTDFLREEGGLLMLPDPVFALWLNLEEVRRDPDAVLRNPPALRRLLVWYEAQQRQDRQEMGALFERRVENLVRRFRGQVVDGRLFGLHGEIRLPVVRDAGRVRVDDPEGRYGDGPNSYEIDVTTTGDSRDDRWAIEVKHRQGALTRAMVERFQVSTRAVEAARGLRFARLWIVAPRGLRPDAQQRAREAGVLISGLRQLERLDRLLAASFDLVPPGDAVPADAE